MTSTTSWPRDEPPCVNRTGMKVQRCSPSPRGGMIDVACSHSMNETVARLESALIGSPNKLADVLSEAAN